MSGHSWIHSKLLLQSNAPKVIFLGDSVNKFVKMIPVDKTNSVATLSLLRHISLTHSSIYHSTNECQVRCPLCVVCRDIHHDYKGDRRRDCKSVVDGC